MAEAAWQTVHNAEESGSADSMSTLNQTRTILMIAQDLLDARIAETNHDYRKALDSFFKGVKAEDSMAYDEPPQWSHPVRESSGGFLLRIGNYAAAEGQCRNDLERNKHNGRSWFGITNSLKA